MAALQFPEDPRPGDLFDNRWQWDGIKWMPAGFAGRNEVGEHIESIASSASFIGDGTWRTATTINLPAGDWDVSGQINYQGAMTGALVDISTSGSSVGRHPGTWAGSTVISNFGVVVGPRRFSLSETTTVNLLYWCMPDANGSFSISARRMRQRWVPWHREPSIKEGANHLQIGSALIQWGRSGSGDSPVTFPIAFAAAPYVFVSVREAAVLTTNTAYAAYATGVGATGFVARPRYLPDGVANPASESTDWLAIGSAANA